MSIPLRSRRGQIGTSPQAVALREQIEAQVPASRASAGRRAARAGRVQWIDIAAGAARGEVLDDLTGHGVVARLDVRPLPRGDHDALLRIAHDHPELPARLVAGELPTDVARELEAEEIALVPRGAADLTHDCSCHDWPGPCTHVAALAYVLVEAVDEDPTALLTLRGVTLEELAAPIGPRAGAATERAETPPAHADATAAGAGAGTVSTPADARDADPDAPPPSAGIEPAQDSTPRFDPTRADARLLVDVLGEDVARALARFYGADEP